VGIQATERGHARHRTWAYKTQNVGIQDTERGHTRHRTWAYKTQNEDKKAKDKTQHNKLNS
jgi:hypothetical protein